MGKSPEFSRDMLRLVFQAKDIVGVAKASGGSHVYLSLHHAMPVGDQNSNEVSCFGYGRSSQLRNDETWLVEMSSLLREARCRNLYDVIFEAPKFAVDGVTHVGIGTDRTGYGHLLYAAELRKSVDLKPYKEPCFAPGDIVVRER